MGALAQGSVLVAKGDCIDRQRLWMAYELFETTSPSVPILATLDATRSDHALYGERMWTKIIALSDWVRKKLSAISPLKVFGREHLPAGTDLDVTKVLIDVSGLGVSGYAIDDWLYAHHRISVGLSDGTHLLLVLSVGTMPSDLHKLVHALKDLVEKLGSDRSILPSAPVLPKIGTLSVEMLMAGPEALSGPAELVRYENAAGRIAAEMLAPTWRSAPGTWPTDHARTRLLARRQPRRWLFYDGSSRPCRSNGAGGQGRAAALTWTHIWMLAVHFLLQEAGFANCV